MMQDQCRAVSELTGRAHEDAVDVTGRRATRKRRRLRRRWRRAVRRMLQKDLALPKRSRAVLARDRFLPGGRGIELAGAPHTVAGAVAEADRHLEVRNDVECAMPEGRGVADAVVV